MIYILIIFIIYLILLIKYYFRYYLPEIIQLPENQNINNYFYNNNRNIIIFKKNSSLTLSNIKEFQNEKLITIYNSNQKIKIPGKVFLELCNKKQKNIDQQQLYYKHTSKQLLDLCKFIQPLYYNNFMYIFPSNYHLEIKNYKTHSFWWQIKGNSKMIIFPFNKINSKIFAHHNYFWKDYEKLQGSQFIEIKLSPNQVIIIPPHCWFAVEILETSIVYQSSFLKLTGT